MWLYGKVLNQESWNEYVTGVDMEVFAIGYFSIPAQKYQIIITNYGSRTGDAFRGVSWGKFVKKVFKEGVDIVK